MNNSEPYETTALLITPPPKKKKSLNFMNSGGSFVRGTHYPVMKEKFDIKIRIWVQIKTVNAYSPII